VSFLSIIYAVIGVQMLLSSFLQMACICESAGRQTKTLRERYFGALLRQDIAFFDVNDRAALATSIMERTLVFQVSLLTIAPLASP
jgi:ABC-type multidrug transport system fused ATPase/permease subunit